MDGAQEMFLPQSNEPRKEQGGHINVLEETVFITSPASQRMDIPSDAGDVISTNANCLSSLSFCAGPCLVHRGKSCLLQLICAAPSFSHLVEAII